MGERPVADITDRHDVFDLKTDSYVGVVKNLITGPIKSLWMLPRDCFSPNNPHTDLYITGGHRIDISKIDNINESLEINNDNDINQEVKVRDLKCAVRVKIDPSPVYSIVCEKHSTLVINGLPVVAFGQDEIE